MKGRAAPVAALLVALGAIAYLPLLRNGFVIIDDALYVTGNPQVRAGLSPAGIAWALRSVEPWAWHPLTWISHMADVSLFGLDPRGHHASSLLLHLAGAALLFLLLRSLTGWHLRSALAAALFAVHPIHVETVAWVAERKGVLSSFFFLLALLAYVRYARRPGAARYVAVAVCAAASLMAKQMAATLPAVLLLLDLWPLGRFRAPPSGSPSPGGPGVIARGRVLPLVLEKTPIALLAAGGAAIAFFTQSREGAVMSLADFPLGERLGNAAVSCLHYLGKAAWPAKLACFYPHPAGGRPLALEVAAAAALAGITLVAIAAVRRRPWLLAGWLWYLVTLLPVIGIVQLGWHAMADRYLYLPLIGAYLVVAAAAGEFAARPGRFRRVVAACLAAVCLVALGVATWRQVGFWRDDLRLFSHALAVTEDNWFAHNNLGEVYARQGRPDLAAAHFREAIRLNRAFATSRPAR